MLSQKYTTIVPGKYTIKAHITSDSWFPCRMVITRVPVWSWHLAVSYPWNLVEILRFTFFLKFSKYTVVNLVWSNKTAIFLWRFISQRSNRIKLNCSIEILGHTLIPHWPVSLGLGLYRRLGSWSSSYPSGLP